MTKTEMHLGDCLQVMPTLSANSVNFCFADLPYAATVADWDVLIDLSAFWPTAQRCGTPSCQFAFTSNMRLAASLICSNASQFRYDLVWKKNRPTGHLNAKKQPLRMHENILIFYGQNSLYHPQMTPGAPYSVGTRKANKNYGAVKPLHFHSNISGDRFPVSILDVPTQQLGMHPTQKPVALLEWLIRTYTNEGDTVLDPVAGSGTTAIACLNTNRNFIGIEKDKTYFAVAKKRIDEHKQKLGH